MDEHFYQQRAHIAEDDRPYRFGVGLLGQPSGVRPQWGPAFDPDTGDALPPSLAGIYTANAPSYQPTLGLNDRVRDPGAARIPIPAPRPRAQLGVGDWADHGGVPYGLNPGSIGHSQVQPILEALARLLAGAPGPSVQQADRGLTFTGGGAARRVM